MASVRSPAPKKSNGYARFRDGPIGNSLFSNQRDTKASMKSPFAYTKGLRTTVKSENQHDIEADGIHLTYELKTTVRETTTREGYIWEVGLGYGLRCAYGATSSGDSRWIWYIGNGRRNLSYLLLMKVDSPCAYSLYPSWKLCQSSLRGVDVALLHSVSIHQDLFSKSSPSCMFWEALAMCSKGELRLLVPLAQHERNVAWPLSHLSAGVYCT